jgi:hypothetical protein
LGTYKGDSMQIQITLEPEQEENFELAEVLRAFAADYDNWMIKSVKSGRHTLHAEDGGLVASLEIVEGAKEERDLPPSTHDLHIRYG